MKHVLYLASGVVFAWGLLLSGMADPQKVKGFLSIGTSDWSAALLFVLAPAAAVYAISFQFLRRRGRTLSGSPFAHPQPRPTDRKLVVGSILFGIGWGIAGVCPGPALVHIAFLDSGFLAFVLSMFIGFEVQRRTT